MTPSQPSITCVHQREAFLRCYYRDVEKAGAVNKQTLKFSFKHNDNRELALILGQIPVIKSRLK